MQNQIDRILINLYNHVRSETLDAIPDDDLASIVCVIDNNHEPSDVQGRVQQIRLYRKELARLRAIPLIAQRTNEWYELRKQRLTASDTAQAIGCGKFGTRKQLLQKKILESQGKSAPFKSAPAMKWGVMFEPMALRTYQSINNDVSVYEFGLIPHPTLDCYGASPDGITELGIMVEIKCPYRRQITGEIPDYYELQMQGQMAVCGLDECDYIECDMQVFDDETEYIAEADKHHGVICEFARGDDTWYEYSDAHLSPQQAIVWAREFASREMRRDHTITLLKLHMWRLRNISVQRVHFDKRRWEDTIVPDIIKFWNDVISCKSVASTTLDISTNVTRNKKYKFIPDDD